MGDPDKASQVILASTNISTKRKEQNRIAQHKFRQRRKQLLLNNTIKSSSSLSDTRFLTMSGSDTNKGFIDNAIRLGITVSTLSDDSSISSFALSPLPHASNLGDLAPVEAQSLLHHPWVDILPFPQLRHNIIHAIQFNALDEDVFCESMQSAFICWGSVPSLAQSWQFQEAFIRQWSWLLDEESIKATNFWRMMQGMDRIELVNEWEGCIT